jgi:hypothetical protein
MLRSDGTQPSGNEQERLRFAGFGSSDPNKVSGLISGLLTGIGSPFWAVPFAFLGNWIGPDRQYHFVRS